MTIGRAALVWIVGLVVGVPWATWYLFFEAPREQYALLITGILFWIFGYWSLVGPLLIAVRLRAVLRALENAQTADEFAATLRGAETREVAIDLLASEARLPRFVARRLFDHVVRRLAEQAAEERGGAPAPGGASRRRPGEEPPRLHP